RNEENGKMATRNGSAEWNGDLRSGSGRLTVGERAWTADYSFASRFQDGRGANPEELIATAHAACFAMALSHSLSEAGHVPRSIKAVARVHMRNIDGLPTLHRIDLEVEGQVPDLDQERFQRHAEQAKTGCAVSRALRGVEQITLSAKLNS